MHCGLLFYPFCICTVEPAVSGHPRDQKKCPLKRVVCLWEVQNAVSA